MSETEIDTDTEPHQPVPLPGEAERRILRMILDGGNSCFLDADDGTIAGTPLKPGQVVPVTSREIMLIIGCGLLAGERNLLMLTRTGRHFVATGELVRDDGELTTTDVDLAAWGRGEIDYPEAEVLEAIDAFFGRAVTTRQEALDVIIEKGVIAPDEAVDVDVFHVLPGRQQCND